MVAAIILFVTVTSLLCIQLYYVKKALKRYKGYVEEDQKTIGNLIESGYKINALLEASLTREQKMIDDIHAAVALASSIDSSSQQTKH